MKSLLSRTLLAAFAVAFAVTATPASAETVIGVVNTQKIMRDAKAAQSVRSQLQTKQKSFQTEIDTKEKQLRTENEALVKQQSSVDKAAFEQKLKEFRAKAVQAERDVGQKKLAIDKALADAISNIQNQVLAITKEVAAEKKMNLVVSSTQTLYADPSLDITQEVLDRLNKKLPNVSVKF